ncbi:hypothetical protein KIW84_061726 [Lathyrus oleraceus]|uniref:BED-type domain-containing protein n=1 Tax=Pisum sativum TaxID=3888 RepID=A0A9D4W387_PEA|nr:hypothetical protein KIW84_061726 [Pisum sativum]
MEQGDSSREVPPVGLEIMEQEQQDTATEALIPPIDHSRKRRRPNADGPKKKSSCWDHFIELTDVVERTAACKHCHKRYRCDPKSHGTSNMLAHSKICYKNPYLENDLKQTNLAFGSGGLISVSPKFDKEACRKAITLFVILDEHPFRGTYFKDINYTEEFGITEEIISEFQQCFITANIGAAGAGAAVGGATGAAVGSTQTQPIGCD